jgi:peptidoglycan/LPS O-acetylase OafA/YrhL
MRDQRTDIQVLRAVAVLAVLVFHVEWPGLPKGFLGVDIFFVMSGYLMSGAIMRELDAGEFRLSGFFLRRARRLLPAAWATLALTTAVAPFVLTRQTLQDYLAQLAGALSFGANFVLWQQSGYFDGDAALKPLLHTWSLSLEEQFYFALPLVLMVTNKRWRALVLLLLALASAGLCLWWRQRDPSGTFYLLPTRAWELLTGSLCALPGLASRLARLPGPDTAWLSLPVLAWCLAQGIDPVHPRFDALLVTCATAALLVRPSALLTGSAPLTKPLAWVGDRSYSLYLVHWPLIALAHSIWLEGPSPLALATLVAVSFALAHLSFTFVETPTRQAKTWAAFGKGMAWQAPMALLASAPLVHAHLDSRATAIQALYRPNHGLARVCDSEGGFKARPECATSASPRTAIWGDSFAMHLVPAFQASAPPGGFVQLTRSACAPLLDMARQLPNEPAYRSYNCLAFNKAVLRYLAWSPGIEYVVISAKWSYLFNDPVVDARSRPLHPDEAALTASLLETIALVHKLGKKVLLVSPPASLGPDVDLGECTQRRTLGLWTTSALTDQDCAFAHGQARFRQGASLNLLRQAATLGKVPVIWLDDYTCRQGRCESWIDGQPLYRDSGHLTVTGAARLGERIKLAQVVKDLAR